MCRNVPLKLHAHFELFVLVQSQTLDELRQAEASCGLVFDEVPNLACLDAPRASTQPAPDQRTGHGLKALKFLFFTHTVGLVESQILQDCQK